MRHTYNSYRAKHERTELPSNVVNEKKTLNPDRAQNEKNTKLTSPTPTRTEGVAAWSTGPPPGASAA